MQIFCAIRDGIAMANKSFYALKNLVFIYLLVTVVLPLAVLFAAIEREDIQHIFSSVQFFYMLRNSICTGICATAISILLSFCLALALNRSNVLYKSVFVVLFTIPMLIPSISHGTGLVLLFGDNGLITNLLGINIGLYGYTGIIIGSVLYSFPVSFLMFHDAFQYEDYAVYEAAKVLGLSKLNQFCAITLPYLRRTILSATLAVFTMVFTDYGVALMVGGTFMTLPVYMYREVVGMMDFSNGSVIGMILLLPAMITFLMDMCSSEHAGTAIRKHYQVDRNRHRDILAYCFFFLVLFLLCLPILAFICLSFIQQYPIDLTLSLDTFRKLLSSEIEMYLVNSLATALLTSLAGTCLSYFCAYVTALSENNAAAKILHFISMLPLAIPGVVLGLSFVLTFNNTGLYSTLFILVMVNIVHFFSSPYLLAYNSLTKCDHNLNAVAQSLGISRMHMLLDVYIPCTIPTIIEMYSYYFVNSTITISAVSFLVNFRTMPLSLLIPQLDSQSFIEGTAFVSLLILVINLGEKCIAFLLKRYTNRRYSF